MTETLNGVVLSRADVDKLREQIVSEVTASVRQLLSKASEPQLVGRERMAELLGISLAKLDRITSSHDIPSVLIGKRRLYEAQEVVSSLSNSREFDS